MNSTYNLEIQINGAGSDKGQIMLAIFNDSENFPDGKPFKKIVLKLDQKKANTVFILPKGKYAIAVYHDENENEKLDKNFMGVPTEKYGFSKNATARFSAPGFQEAAFELSNDHKETIQLR